MSKEFIGLKMNTTAVNQMLDKFKLLESTIEQQSKQIEGLKNCINCKHIEIESCGDYLCKKNFPDKLEKCRHWEGITCADQQQKK